MDVEADIFSPSALGAILTESSVAALKVKAVAGGANNQLATGPEGQMLADRGIFYAPDYVINAGGIINVLRHIDGAGDAEINRRIDAIPGGWPRFGRKATQVAPPRPWSPTRWRKGLSGADAKFSKLAFAAFAAVLEASAD